MMKSRIGMLMFFYFVSILVHGQKFSAALSDDFILIGEPCTINLKFESKKSFEAPQLLTNLENLIALKTVESMDSIFNAMIDVEVLSIGQDSVYKDEENFIWSKSLVVTAWDSMSLIMPPFELQVLDSVFDTAPLLLNITFPEKLEDVEAYDIFEVFSEVEPDFDFWSFIKSYGWIFLIITVALVLLFLKMKNNKNKEIIQLTPKEKAFLALDELEGKGLFKSNMKEHYFELSIILRKFLSQAYHVKLLEATTEEVNSVLKNNKELALHLNEISEMLDLSDLVKFAKSEPSPEKVKSSIKEVKELVEKLSPNNDE